MSIIEKTKKFLKESSWTQAQLAKEIGVHPITLNRYLHKKFRKNTTDRLLEFFESNPETCNR